MSDFEKYSDEEIIDFSSKIGSEFKKRGYEYGWYKKEQYVGAIYILFNPAFRELVKIGYADDVQKRMDGLNRSSSLPDPFHCYASYKVKKRLGDKQLHSLIDTLDPTLRHAKNREFYEMDCEKAYEILSAIAQINGDEEQLMKNPFSDPFFEVKSSSEVKKTNNTNQKHERLTFGMLGIPVGSTLVFVKNKSMTCITADEVNKVKYNGEVVSMSALAAKLLGYGPVQGGKYFMYNNEVLTDVRKRLGV